jgi:hypothetical protein
MVSTLGGGGLRWRWSWCECIDAPLHHRSIQAFVIVTLTYEMCLCVNRQLKHRYPRGRYYLAFSDHFHDVAVDNFANKQADADADTTSCNI